MRFYTDDEPDTDAPYRRLSGRCSECWTYAGHAAGCPENTDDDREEAADNTQH